MKIVKLVLTGVLLISLVFPVFSAGSNETSGEEMVITWLGKPEEECDTTAGIEYLYEKTGIKVVPNYISLRDVDKINVMLAAGEFPDVGQLPGGQPVVQYYLDGVIRGIPFSMMQEHMPGYVAMMNKYPEAKLMDRNPDTEDEYLVVHGFWEAYNGMMFAQTIRADYIRNVGIALPEYESAKIPIDPLGKVYYFDYDLTVDELEQILIKFRDGDPDGNGKVDTIPYSAYGTGPHEGGGRIWGQLMGAYGVGSGTNAMVDGELVEYNIHPGYKDFLKTAQRWYAMDLIDKEFMSDNRAKWFEKLNAGIAAYNPGANVTVVAGDMLDRPPMGSISEEDVKDGAEFILLPPLVGPDGKRGMPQYSVTPVAEEIGVGAHVGDEKLALILQALQFTQYGTDEDWLRCFKGVPGVHFNWEGEAWNSRAQIVPASEIPDGYPKDGYMFLQWPPRNYWYSRVKFNWWQSSVDWLHGVFNAKDGPGYEYAYHPYRRDFLAETDLAQVLRKNSTTMNGVRDQFFLKAVTGQVDIDTEWDGYVEEWLKAGGRAYLEELEKSPVVGEFLKGNLAY